MKLKYLSFMMGAVAAYPKISIKENGSPMDLYMVGACTQTQGSNSISIPHPGGCHLSRVDSQEPQFYTPNLLGGSIEYDVNLSKSGCSCNAALYLSKMPAKDESGNLIPGSNGNYYCDANQVGGIFCPEFDIMEANTYAWHTTPHKCDAPNEKGHYYNCDKIGGCFTVAHGTISYGPGDSFQINTLKGFHVKIIYNADASYKVEMT